ncbi:hypothetical protein KL86SPO_50097 [uncultured Sporomusa sp.]|uniref:Uncharacterized protein n=1 Tax=uncultured Sporomusa sp. TaxID=307249 RepID=A0A212LXU5_9FIRM|nr:hypothetical protein KL86SPO_50097 [uncultured Sporomusa sp.]
MISGRNLLFFYLLVIPLDKSTRLFKGEGDFSTVKIVSQIRLQSISSKISQH